MAPARFAATGGCGVKPGKSEAKCSLRSMSWVVSSEPWMSGFQPVGGVQMVLHPLLSTLRWFSRSDLAACRSCGERWLAYWGNRSPVRMCSRITSIPRSFWASTLRNEGIQHRVRRPSRCELLNRWIVLRSSRGPCPASSNGKSITSFQSVAGVLQRRVGQLADVAEQHRAAPLGVPPPELVVLLELALALDAKLLEEHLPHAADAVALVILAAGLLDDALGVHAGKLHGDRGVDLLADTDLAHAGRPGPARAGAPPGPLGRGSACGSCRGSRPPASRRSGPAAIRPPAPGADKSSVLTSRSSLRKAAPLGVVVG